MNIAKLVPMLSRAQRIFPFKTPELDCALSTPALLSYLSTPENVPRDSNKDDEVD